MKWPAFLTRSAPPTPPFVCLQHYPVTICFTGDLIGQGIGGLQTIADQLMHRHINWHDDRFQHDDITDPELLRRTTNILRRQQVRRYFKSDQCRLESFDGKTLVIPPEGTNGFFAGFAPTLMVAMTYVASGDEKALVKPW